MVMKHLIEEKNDLDDIFGINCTVGDTVHFTKKILNKLKKYVLLIHDNYKREYVFICYAT
jgi:hypothetical protein